MQETCFPVNIPWCCKQCGGEEQEGIPAYAQNVYRWNCKCLDQIEAGEDGKFKKYLPPIVGEDVVKVKFDTEIYSAIVENDGETGQYLKTVYYNCVGQNKPLSFKDDNYFVAEYGIQSRPANGERPYDFEVVTGLPK